MAHNSSVTKPSTANHSIMSAASSQSPMDETEESKSAADNSGNELSINNHDSNDSIPNALPSKSLPDEKDAPRVVFVLGHPDSGKTLVAESFGEFAAGLKSTFVSHKRTHFQMNKSRVHILSETRYRLKSVSREECLVDGPELAIVSFSDIFGNPQSHERIPAIKCLTSKWREKFVRRYPYLHTVFLVVKTDDTQAMFQSIECMQELLRALPFPGGDSLTALGDRIHIIFTGAQQDCGRGLSDLVSRVRKNEMRCADWFRLDSSAVDWAQVGQPLTLWHKSRKFKGKKDGHPHYKLVRRLLRPNLDTFYDILTKWPLRGEDYHAEHKSIDDIDSVSSLERTPQTTPQIAPALIQNLDQHYRDSSGSSGQGQRCSASIRKSISKFSDTVDKKLAEQERVLKRASKQHRESLSTQQRTSLQF